MNWRDEMRDAQATLARKQRAFEREKEKLKAERKQLAERIKTIAAEHVVQIEVRRAEERKDREIFRLQKVIEHLHGFIADGMRDVSHAPECLQSIDGLLPVVTIQASGVYFLCQDNAVVYVGQSVNIFSRVGAHVGEKQKLFNHAYFLPIEGSLDSEERYYIDLLMPVHNNDTQTRARRRIHQKRLELEQQRTLENIRFESRAFERNKTVLQA